MGRNYTRELRAAQERGATIVCSLEPYRDRMVEYKPRTATDPAPWIVVGLGVLWYRLNGRECHAVDR